jgi:hypothetical protein
MYAHTHGPSAPQAAASVARKHRSHRLGAHGHGETGSLTESTAYTAGAPQSRVLGSSEQRVPAACKKQRAAQIGQEEISAFHVAQKDGAGLSGHLIAVTTLTQERRSAAAAV